MKLLEEGLGRLTAENFDVVLVDLSDRCSLEVVTRIRAVTSSVPIVLLISSGNQGLADQARRADVEAYLFKEQLNPALLVHTLQYAVELRRIKEENAQLLLQVQIAQAEAEATQKQIISLLEGVTEKELIRAKDELARQLADMAHLYKLSTHLSMTMEFDRILEEVITSATTLVSTNMGTLLLYDREKDDLYTVASVGFTNEYLNFVRRIPLSAGICGRTVLECRRFIIEDIEADPLLTSYLPIARLGGYRAICSTPLLTQSGDIMGAIVVYFREPHTPSDRELHLLDLYVPQASQVIHNTRLYREIREENRRKDEFLAILAHELRNPLAPIRNSLELIRLQDLDNPVLHRSIEVIKRQTRYMTRLLDDLLDISRITRGKVTLQKEILDLATVVNRAVETSRPLIEARQHQLLVSLPEEPVQLEADPLRLEQILVNLLNNAAKYTEPGGRIWLSAHQEGGEIVLRVKDTGIGISQDMLSRIFDLFIQVDQSLTRIQGGLGIGLTLVRSLVEMHGGKVQAFSAGLSQGSEFVVRLPALKTPPKSLSDPKGIQAIQKPLRVLIVDDHLDTLTTLRDVVTLWGYEVQTAQDGPTAIELALTFQPQVILLDLCLPGVDGYEVARRLRQETGLSNVVLIALTVYKEELVQPRFQEARFDYHFVKPIDLPALRKILYTLASNTHPD
ncbi:MAG TPA: ATP-binding protein [Candidatus Limnocylindrales bacterium]|nr:ATP-binding protein [Candidatus Limnocylindrales bacterium]